MPASRIIQVDESKFETELDRMVSSKVEEILNTMLDAEAEQVAGAGRYERSLTVKAGSMSVKVPKLKGALFESAVIRRYRTRESRRRGGAHGHVLQRRLDPAGRRHQSGALGRPHAAPDPLGRSEEGLQGHRLMAERPLERDFPYVFMDGIWLKRSWGGKWKTSACSSPSASATTAGARS